MPSDLNPDIEAPAARGRVSAPASVSLSEVLAALSHALDLTEGQVAGHTIRSCIIGMRIADELGMRSEDRSALYYALLLKDAGCSSNASRMASLFGSDDRSVKPRMKAVDWHRRLRLAVNTAMNVGRGESLATRVRHFLLIARSGEVTRDLIALRCERGASIATRLGFPAATADAIRSLDEHWSGLGYAHGLSGDEIPVLARICNLAQTVDAFHSSHGLATALRIVKRRRGTWFDPALVRIVLGIGKDEAFWNRLRSEAARDLVVSLEPADQVITADSARLDEVALAFADIIDAKSPYTYHHSLRVAEGARFIAAQLGMAPREVQRIYRAGLLHDIGKLGVSSLILNKEGALTADERAEIERHPRYSFEILSRVVAFGEFAWTASTHHERLDGTGYPWRLGAEQLDEPARILAVADVYDALVSDRPYRPGMTRERAMAILRAECETKLSSAAVQAIESWTVPA